MKTKFKVLAGCAVAAIATVATVNVSLSMKSDKQQLSDLQLANVEALAQVENSNKEPKGWDEITQETNHYSNKKLFKKSVIVNCHEDGPLSQCTPSCKYQQIKSESGNTWTDWMPC